MNAYEGNDPFIFVSYAHNDRDIVFPIIELLQNNGYHVWYDEGLHVGNDWRDELADRISNCHAFIFMMSNESAKSGYCRDEIYAADSAMKTRMDSVESDEDEPLSMVTIMLEKADLSSGIRLILGSKQMISGIGSSAQEIIDKLIASEKLEKCRDSFRYVEGENWGPARNGYYLVDPPDYPVMNSTVDNPLYGDERHFLAINGRSQNASDHFVELVPGNEYTVEIFYCNDGDPHLNTSGSVITLKLKVEVDLPERLNANKVGLLQANVSYTVGEYGKVWDQIALYCPEDVRIDYVTASAVIKNFGKLNETVLGTQLFNEGVYIGYNKFSGILPAGLQYSGSIQFKFKVSPICQVAFESAVSVDGKHFSDHLAVLPGDVLTFRIKLKNENLFDIKDVTFRDVLPDGLEPIPGTAVIYAIPNISRPLSDHLSDKGINTGLFGAGVPAVIQYQAKVSEDITNDCELVTQNHLYFTTIEKDPENRYEDVDGETYEMIYKTTCYVHV